MTPALPSSLRVLERGWLSANNILFADGDDTAIVDTGYCTHAPQTVALVAAALEGRPLRRLVNTHLHSDHCGGNRLFAGVPIHVQARELADARSLDDYTIREWVDFDGATYVEHEGEVEVLPGIRVLPTPGHTDGHQSVLVETGGRPVVIGGDVAVWFGELEEPHTEGQLRVRALEPELVWLAHEHEPWRPRIM